MRQALFASVLFLALATVVSAQPILYEEHFTGGVSQLTWEGATGDSLGNPFTMQVLNDPTTPGGDGWIGAVTVPFDYAGSPGLAFSGPDTLKDYSVEAWIYCVVQNPTGPYNGIVARYDSTGGLFRLYVLRTDFDSSKRIRLTYLEGANVTIIRDWSQAEVPGGVPTTSSWHKLGLKAVGNQLWAYYDDSLLVGCPYTNDTLSQGFFGIYGWNMVDSAQTRCDDVIVRDERPGPGSPTIVLTSPADGDTGVAAGTAVVVHFSQPMDTSSAMFSVRCSPDSMLGWTAAWGSGDSVVTLAHIIPFQSEVTETLTIVRAYSKTGDSLIAGPVPNPWTFRTQVVGIADGPGPGEIRISSLSLTNFPNPWRSTTSFAVELPHASSALFQVYDVTGRIRRTLLDQPMPAGRHLVSWDGRDEQGKALPSGVYFYHLNLGQASLTGRTTLLR